jgi:uncharacterized protein (DUF1330 family)
MPGYMIADVNVTDPEGFEEYRKLVAATIEAYGGRYLVRGGATDTVEGDWNPSRLVVVEFDSVEQAKAWYYSEEYAGPKSMRHNSAATNAIFVEGA